jgi:ferredoxin
MPYTITRLCIDCVDTGCVRICPVDCIYQPTQPGCEGFPNQLYVDPVECIDCGACEPECPWGAIFPEQAVPPALCEDIALNHALREDKARFRIASYQPRALPAPEAVAANRAKWGLDSRQSSAPMAEQFRHAASKRDGFEG